MADPLPPPHAAALPLAGGSAVATNGSSGPPPLLRPTASHYMQLAVTIDSARLNHNANGLHQLLIKPSPYVELSVNAKPPKRTDICKSSTHPKWHAELSVIVTPCSRLAFRLYDHSTFKKDVLLAGASLDLWSVLRQHNGRLHELELALDLRKNCCNTSETPEGGGGGTASNGGGEVSSVIGILYVKLNGAQVDMSRFMPPSAAGASGSSPEEGHTGTAAAAAASTSSTSLSTR
jgi:hypothetical protein